MSRLWWPDVLVLAVFTYTYSLDGLHIPHIGDEAPYIQIVRLTAESGDWLPLKTTSGLENTKPPLLFWLGMVSTDWLPWCTTPIEAESSLGPDSHHPIISVSGIPSAVMVLRILHPILASPLCAANPLARIAEPTIAL